MVDRFFNGLDVFRGVGFAIRFVVIGVAAIWWLAAVAHQLGTSSIGRRRVGSAVALAQVPTAEI